MAPKSKEICFDERYYLIANPDVAIAVENGKVASGYEHWIRYGVKEGREPFLLWPDIDLNDFDEVEYLKANPDVAAAVEEGRYPSGFVHFARSGWREVTKGLRALNTKDEVRVVSRFQLKDHVFMMMNANLIKDPGYFRREMNNWFTSILETAAGKALDNS